MQDAATLRLTESDQNIITFSHAKHRVQGLGHCSFFATSTSNCDLGGIQQPSFTSPLFFAGRRSLTARRLLCLDPSFGLQSFGSFDRCWSVILPLRPPPTSPLWRLLWPGAISWTVSFFGSAFCDNAHTHPTLSAQL